MKQIGVTLLVVALLAVTAAFSYRFASFRYRSQITVLQGEVSLYKAEAEKYAAVLTTIRQAAAAATGSEEAP